MTSPLEVPWELWKWQDDGTVIGIRTKSTHTKKVGGGQVEVHDWTGAYNQGEEFCRHIVELHNKSLEKMPGVYASVMKDHLEKMEKKRNEGHLTDYAAVLLKAHPPFLLDEEAELHWQNPKLPPDDPDKQPELPPNAEAILGKDLPVLIGKPE